MVPWQFVGMRPARRPGRCLGTARRSLRHIPRVLEAGSVATVAVLSSHRPLIAVLTLSLAPLLLVLWLLRGFGPSRIAVAE